MAACAAGHMPEMPEAAGTDLAIAHWSMTGRRWPSWMTGEWLVEEAYTPPARKVSSSGGVRSVILTLRRSAQQQVSRTELRHMGHQHRFRRFVKKQLRVDTRPCRPPQQRAVAADQRLSSYPSIHGNCAPDGCCVLIVTATYWLHQSPFEP